MVANHVEIMSFGGPENGGGGLQTVPRKRRPRARGEVYVTSCSHIYLNDAPTSEQPTPMTQDPIYENTANGSEVYQNLIGHNKIDTVDVYQVRVNVLESDRVEIQQVAAFIDGIRSGRF